MSFFSTQFSASINQPKMRQEGFHLPSPTPSNGNPPSPPSNGSNSFDIFLPHHASHQTHSAPHNGGGNSHFPNLTLPDAFSRSGGAMDFGDELASLMTNSPATSNERSTHSPPHGFDSHNANGTDAYRPPHNIFDISAPSTHYNHHAHGAHAFSLPHASHRPDLTISQPSSLHSPHGFDHHHHHHHQPLGRDSFTGHFNATIPPLSTHHDPVPQPSHSNGQYGQPSYTPTSAHPPSRETPSPVGTSRPNTGHGRSGSRSRSRAPAGTGPTRTTKTTSKRRDSLSLGHTSLTHAHLPSPPGGPGVQPRPQAIVIPSHSHSQINGRGPASPMNLVGTPGVGQPSGWFLPSQGGNPGSAPGAEFSLPTPDSVGHGHAFGQFGTSVSSMGISPKDTNPASKGESSSGDPASKQAAIVSEKRRRRRESHNAVERRRRDNINEKISELATLIPEVMLDPSATPSSAAANGNGNSGEEAFSGLAGETPTKKESAAAAAAAAAAAEEEAKEGGPVKANKGMILRKSVEYIRYLQQLVNAQAARNRDLEAQLVRAGVSGKPGGKDGRTPLERDGLNGFSGADDDVLNLHSFSPESDSPGGADYMGMNLGMNGMSMHMKGMGMGFDHLEPMVESNEIEMDESGMEHDGHIRHHHHHLTHGQRLHQRHERDGSGDLESVGEEEKTSPSVVSEEDGVSARDAEEEQEERGRRGRDGRVGHGINVKEESLHMEV